MYWWGLNAYNYYLITVSNKVIVEKSFLFKSSELFIKKETKMLFLVSLLAPKRVQILFYVYFWTVNLKLKENNFNKRLKNFFPKYRYVFLLKF